MKTTILSLLLLTTLLCRSVFCDEIHDAARDGDLEKIQALLKDNPDLVSSKESHGWTPLHYAAANGYTNVTEFLLSNKAEVNAKNNDGRTPLHMAALNGYKDVAGLLLLNKAEVNAKDNNGDTPLQLVSKSQQSLVDLLREHGGIERQIEVYRITSPDRDGFAIGLNAKGIHVASDGTQAAGEFTDLVAMSRQPGNQRAVSLLKSGTVKDGVINVPNFGAIQTRKSKDSQTPVLEFLMTDEQIAKIRGDLGLHSSSSVINGGIFYAAQYGDLAKVKAQIEVNPALLNAREPMYGTTPLHQAAAAGQTKVVRYLLSKGADPNATDQTGQTALHYISSASSYQIEIPEDVVKLLVKNGANINSCDTNGDTPLLLAAFYQKLSNIKLLIKYGATVDLQDKQGDTALTTILGSFEFRMKFEPNDTTEQKEARDFAILDYLLYAGANPNIKDMKGNTALHLVPIEVPGPEQVSAAKDLVKHGADVTAKNNESKTAIDFSQGALRVYLERAAKSLR